MTPDDLDLYRAAALQGASLAPIVVARLIDHIDALSGENKRLRMALAESAHAELAVFDEA